MLAPGGAGAVLRECGILNQHHHTWVKCHFAGKTIRFAPARKVNVAKKHLSCGPTMNESKLLFLWWCHKGQWLLSWLGNATSGCLWPPCFLPPSSHVEGSTKQEVQPLELKRLFVWGCAMDWGTLIGTTRDVCWTEIKKKSTEFV